MDNEIDMLKRLKEKNIVLKEYEFDKSKIIDIQDKFETLINSNPAFENLAQDAYKSYIFHICLVKLVMLIIWKIWKSWIKKRLLGLLV